MNRYFSRLIALVLVVVIGLMGCSSSSSMNMTGDYRQDALSLVQSLRTAIELPEDSPSKAAAQAEARQDINDFASRYRRNDSLSKLSSYTNLRTALNNLAGHYSSYPNRPVPEKLKNRLEQQFTQIENALNREA